LFSSSALLTHDIRKWPCESPAETVQDVCSGTGNRRGYAFHQSLEHGLGRSLPSVCGFNPMQTQAAAHLVCERATLSKVPVDELRDFSGTHDPRVAAQTNVLFSKAYDQNLLSFTGTVRCDSLIITRLQRRLAQDDGTTLTLGYTALVGGGRNTLALFSGDQCRQQAAIEDVRVPRLGLVQRPLDIMVQFGLGARVFAQFGTAAAKEFAESSPMAIEYRLKRFQSTLPPSPSPSAATRDRTVSESRLAGFQAEVAASERNRQTDLWRRRNQSS
jgi:hypothetical protein